MNQKITLKKLISKLKYNFLTDYQKMFTERWRSLFMHTLSKKLYSIFYNRKYIVGFTQLQNNFRHSFNSRSSQSRCRNSKDSKVMKILIFGLHRINWKSILVRFLFAGQRSWKTNHEPLWTWCGNQKGHFWNELILVSRGPVRMCQRRH